jgi:hypothetical protein
VVQKADIPEKEDLDALLEEVQGREKVEENSEMTQYREEV